MTSASPAVPGPTKASPIEKHARIVPAVSMTWCRPNRATRRRASREPIRPPTHGPAKARPYCQGAKCRWPSMSTASSGAVAMIRALTPIELKNSGRSAGWARMYRHPGRARLAPADGPDPGRRQQEADRVGQHGSHRAEQPEGSPAERWSERGRGPGGGLEPPVGHEQVLARHERLQVGAAASTDTSAGPACRTRIEISENASNASHVPSVLTAYADQSHPNCRPSDRLATILPPFLGVPHRSKRGGG